MGVRDWLAHRIDRLIERRLGDGDVERCDALTTQSNEYGYDAFGFHRDSLRYPVLFSRWLYQNYFRAESFGIENVPAQGRCLVVSNHSGQLPFDGLMITAALFLEPGQPRLARSMVERFVPTLPFVSYLFGRWGQITGTPENCRRLLENEEMILVFPEGARGVSKPFSRRYQLADFGHGFMRLAIEYAAPIIPVAVIGAEEQAPAVDFRPLARLLGTPSFPVVPYPPFFPIVPLPVKYRLYFGEPLHFDGDPDDDDDIIDNKVRAVKNRIQSLLHRGLRERRGVFW